MGCVTGPTQIILSARLLLPIRTLEPLSVVGIDRPRHRPAAGWPRLRRNILSIEQTYELCCRDARAMLAGIDQGRFRAAEEKLCALRRRLETRMPLDPATARGESVLRLEQLEALDGVVSEMMEAFAALRESAEPGLERLRFAMDLVRHLTTHSRGTLAGLPVC